MAKSHKLPRFLLVVLNVKEVLHSHAMTISPVMMNRDEKKAVPRTENSTTYVNAPKQNKATTLQNRI